MSNYKPYFKYLRDFNVNMLIIPLVVICLTTITSIWGSASVYSDKSSIIYTSQSGSMAIVVSFILGFFYSTQIFSHAMSIKADRIGYLKAALIWAIVLSVGIGVFEFLIDTGCKVLLQLITSKPVEIYSQITWISIPSIKYLPTLVNRILSNSVVFSIGFMVGALWYRLKVKYSLIIFVGIPISAVGFIVNYGYRNPGLMTSLGNKLINIYEYLMMNPYILISIAIVSIVASSLVGFRLLVRAPIKDYANDLV